METLTFKVYRGDELVQEQEITQRVIKIGKLDSSHLRIQHEDVSRMHAVIEANGPGVRILHEARIHSRRICQG